MTNEEAIEVLKSLKEALCTRRCADDALENCDETRCHDINAIKMAIEALEKQVAKKPDEKDEYFIDVDWVCPTCGELYNQDHYSAYCPSCGQKIYWG